MSGRFELRRCCHPLLVVLLVLFAAACGYRVASKNRIDQNRSISVKTLENETTTPEIEQLLSRALVQELVRSSRFEVRDQPETADIVLEGRVTRILASPIGFRQDAFASVFLLSVSADITVRERATGKLLFRNSDYTFRDQYVINVEAENFFSETNPALDRISGDFAAGLIASVLEGF